MLICLIPDDLGNGKLNNAVSDCAEDTFKAVEKQESEKEHSQYIHQQRGNNLYCRQCDKTFFSFGKFYDHHLRHVQLPNVIVQCLNPSYVRRLTSKKPLRSGHKGRRRNFARKHTRSYIVPKIKNKVTEPLKLTLKLASDATTEKPSFEVVPHKVLIGPGGLYPANGVLDELKTEVVTESEEVEWNNKSVEGKGGEKGEGTGQTLESTLESSEENSDINNVESVEQDKSEVGFGGGEEDGDNVEEEVVTKEEAEEGAQNKEPTGDTCVDTIADLNLDDNQQQKCRSSCPSPTPSEQLRPEFLAPEEDSCDSLPSPAMVEVSGTALAEAGSPAFPTTSPAPPPTSGDSNSHHSASEQDQQFPPVDNPEGELHSESGDRDDHNVQSNETSLRSETGNFSWNDVGNVPATTTDDPASNAETVEEGDPLMIPDQASADPGHEHNSGTLSDGSPSESLLRGFLCDPSTGDKAITGPAPASGVVGNVIDGLGSEYISLERLGETGALVCCDVCGEQTSNLEEHRARAGHYKCGHQECGNQVFPNLGELASHQHIAHGSGGQPAPQPPPSSQQYPMPHHQPPPVQQLAQQVQRLPVPPPQELSSHQMNHHSPQHQQMSPQHQQMSPQLHQLMPPQQPYPQPPVRRPPPLYRVPGSGNMSGTPPGMQHQYPNHTQQPQHVMPPQMYNQQPYSQSQNNYPAPANVLPTPRPYGNMVQQLNRPRAPSQHSMQRPNIVQQQQPRVGLQQKRSAVMTNSSGSSPNKQRRMDILIPDRHDDADCHVIALQKRTDSGPVIGNVQGAANNSGRPESMIHLTDSITLSVIQPQGGAGVNQPVATGGKNKSDAKAVANILATRGITVTPAGATGGRSVTQQSPQQQQRQSRPPVVTQPAASPVSQPVTTLNLNSAISIIAQPTASSSSSSRQQQVITGEQGEF
jgi:hypothetical protein